MAEQKILSLLGMARRAGRLSLGHDAAEEAIVKNKAKLCLCCADASARLQREMRHNCSYAHKSIPYFTATFSMAALSHAIGSKAAVVTVDDAGFAAKLTSLLQQMQNTGKE